MERKDFFMQKLILNYLNAETKQKDPNFDLSNWIGRLNSKLHSQSKLSFQYYTNRYGNYLDVWAPDELIVRFSEHNILDEKSLGVVLLDALKKIYEYSIYSTSSQFTPEEMHIIFDDLEKFTSEVGLDHDPYYMEKLRDIGRMI